MTEGVREREWDEGRQRLRGEVRGEGEGKRGRIEGSEGGSGTEEECNKRGRGQLEDREKEETPQNHFTEFQINMIFLSSQISRANHYSRSP